MAFIDNPLSDLKKISPGKTDPGAQNLFKTKSSDLKTLGKYTVNSYFWNFSDLSIGDAWKMFDYQFAIHDGEKEIKVLTMPLPPQSISIDVPSAVVTTVTMRGITEEHNDAPLRVISISGTTGLMPRAISTPSSTGSSNVLDYAFKNTISAAKKVVNTFEKAATAISNFTDGKKFNSPLVSVEDIEGKSGQANAYTIIHNMSRFFDMYLAAKRQGAKKLFLSFYMHKDQMYYDCTLNGYSIRKVAGSLEYQYSIKLTAWRRRPVPVGSTRPGAKIAQVNTAVDGQNPFALINATLDSAIKGVNEASGILKGFSKDFDTAVLSPLKKIGLLVKAAGGLATNMSNFPSAISNLSKNAIKEAVKNISAGTGFGSFSEFESLNKKLKVKGLSSPAAVGQKNDYKSNVIINQVSKTESQTTAIEAVDEDDSDPFAEIFKNPEEYQDFFGFFKTEDLNLPSSLQALISNEINAALALTADDVKDMRVKFESFISSYSEAIGGGSEAYNRVSGKGAVRKASKALSVTDIVLLSQFNDIMQVFDKVVIILQESDALSSIDYAAFYSDYAKTNGIGFENNSSKFYVPFEFGASLERMAVKYLGVADRWIEIAAINGLKAPYVDEDGFTIDFKGSGSGTSFSVATTERLYVGQVISISSDTQQAQTRKIKSIDIVSSVEAILTLDGDATLALFKIVDNAKLQAFLPNTVNSNMLLAIPSDVPVNIPGSIRTNPSEEDLSVFNYTAKADFMLVFNNQNFADIAFSSSDVKIARGLTNLVQAANIKVLTKVGDLLQDPTFGNPIVIGSSIAEIDIKKVLADLSDLFSEDPRFKNVLAAKITNKGPTVVTDMLIGLQNSEAYLPFTTETPRS